MTTDLRERMKISTDRLDAINQVLLHPDMRVMNDFLEVVAQYGSPEEINAKAQQARNLENLFARVKESNPAHMEDLQWLREKRDQKAFISIADYRRDLLGEKVEEIEFADDFAVTLEISACQYFPCCASSPSEPLKKAS